MKIHDLKPAAGSKKPRRRVGRGIGGKGGKTAGRGSKGQGARGSVEPGFEGGQTPLHRRTPKAKGFKNPFRVEYVVVNLDTLEEFDAGAVVDPGVLRAHGLVAKRGLVKILGRGELTEGAHRAGPRLLAGRDAGDRGGRWAGRDRAGTRGATAVRRPRERPHQPVSSQPPARALPFPPPHHRRGGRPPMLSRLRNMFRVPDLRNKILFTIFIIAVYRVGTHIPVPYVDFDAIKQLQDQANNGGVVGFLDLFSGGAITSVAIFFLGIMPYITASIIMQLLGVVIPKLEQWQHEGQIGQKKITQWTRYLTVGLALIQSTGFVFAPARGQERPARLRRLRGQEPDPGASTPSRRAHHPHLDRRHRDRHVARRAHHPARHRQRHVDPDLRVGGVAPPGAGRRDLQPRAASSSSSPSSASASR